MTNHLDSALNKKLSQQPLHASFNSGSNGSFLNRKWTVF